MYEHDPAFEALLDHPSVFEKIEPLLGEHFIVHSSWCTMVPAGHEGGGFHQDASGPSQFRRLSASGVAPLVQVRVGFVLTDLSESDCGNLVVVPGSHHAEVALPAAGQEDESLISCAVQLRAKAGSAGGLRKKQPETSLSDPPLCCRTVLFHQGLWHSGGRNTRDFNRFMFHTVYAPSWLRRTDRLANSAAFLENTTPRRRQLMGEFASINEYLMMPPVSAAGDAKL